MTAASVFAAVLPHLLRLPTLFALLILGLFVVRFVQRSLGGAAFHTAEIAVGAAGPGHCQCALWQRLRPRAGQRLACTMLALKLLETEPPAMRTLPWRSAALS